MISLSDESHLFESYWYDIILFQVYEAISSPVLRYLP